ncbi:MAG: ribosomal-protein-alanine N-acetyltransferase [Deltaproteobacteria bacterium]|nr:MAG: ribosomal-protein-alanine N-acetyltransferase [Deltaproteobacteria bacterium]
MTPEIRPMQPADLPGVIRVERACQPHPWDEARFSRELDNPLARLRVICDGEHLCGFMVCWQVADEVEIQNICVAPEYRRKGLGRLLLEDLFNSCPDAERFLLEVRSGNQPAIELYRSFGFQVDGVRPAYYHDGEDAVLMSRPGASTLAGE